MICRHCNSPLRNQVVDLHFSPPSNSYLTSQHLAAVEPNYPLKVAVCNECWLVQTEDFVSANSMFTEDYAYFSSTSSSWMKHAKDYCDTITDRLKLDSSSFVVELASNDGYLLRNFVKEGIRCLGVEPTQSTASAAIDHGVPTVTNFFTERFAWSILEEHGAADLVIGNNVYAHVPDINDFTKGMKTILAKEGVITLEFPHLVNLISDTQFDTIYHEHFSYLSLLTVNNIFKRFGLRVFDVERLSTHGGSLRVHGCHENSSHKENSSVKAILEEEVDCGLFKLPTYEAFSQRTKQCRRKVQQFFSTEIAQGQRIVGYGAAAKGNTLLNYCGITQEDIEFVVDGSSMKQGRFLPGSHIPIYPPSMLYQRKPDVVVILPWNLEKEISAILRDEMRYDGKIVVLLPEPRFL